MPLDIPGFRGVSRDDAEARAVYSEAAGIARVMPHGVVVPRDAEDVAAVVRWARDTRTPLVPRGSGSSMGGGAVGDGVVVDLSRIRDVGAVDLIARRIRVEPGVLRGEVESTAREHGLRFPPDPSSGKYCTVGGMVSTNAAGAHTLRYGATREWVVALDCVFDDGKRATVARGAPLPDGVAALERFAEIAPWLRERDREQPIVHAGVRKESSGYAIHAYAGSGDVVDLLVGSEGTLAIVTGLELALTAAPAATASLLGAFTSLESAVAAAVRAREAGAAACELLDRTFLDVVRRRGELPQVPAGTEAVLLAEVEGDSAGAARDAAGRLAAAFRNAGAATVMEGGSAGTDEAIWELRHAASPILATLGPSLTSMQFIEDGAVPPERLPDYVRGLRGILERHGVRGVIFGHAGDAHVHANPLVDISRADWRGSVRTMLDEAVELTARLGGTLAGEHGDGRLRTPLLGRVWPESALEAFRAVKDAFDPERILNPCVKVPCALERAIEAVKYDPTLPPLPRRARAALDTVARDRAYATSRLALLDAAAITTGDPAPVPDGTEQPGPA